MRFGIQRRLLRPPAVCPAMYVGRHRLSTGLFGQHVVGTNEDPRAYTLRIAAVAIASSEPTVNALVALLGSSGMCRIAPHHNFVSFHGFNQREIHP